VLWICLWLAQRPLPPPCDGLFSTCQNILRSRVRAFTGQWRSKLSLLDLHMGDPETNVLDKILYTSVTFIKLDMSNTVFWTEKVQAELDRVIGQSRQPSMEDRANLPYTDAVIHEVQRMSNIVPLSLPHTTNKEVQLGGYTIPKVISQTHICTR